MPEEETWRSVPLYYAIVEELERRGGRAMDEELYKALKERFNITFSEFLKALMKLEMQGIVYVNVIKEGVRHVELLVKP
jgi:transcription initiation factor IIE alpha subunit